MLKQILFKKEYLLIAGTIILLFISYQFAFEKTFEAWQIHKQLKVQLAQVTDLSYQPGYLERKNSNLSKIIDHYKEDSVAFRSSSINVLASIAEKENVKLSEVPIQDPLFHADKFIIQKLDFEGDFFALTRVLHQLPAVSEIGYVRAATYIVVGKNTNINETKKLVMEVYLELVK